MNLPSKPSRIDFDNIDTSAIQRILSTGELEALTPQERVYFSLMEMVRGLRARMLLPGGQRIVTKAAIIKLLKSDAYGLTDWMARRVYADALNFFYAEDDVQPRAWANLYAEKLEKYADLAASMRNLKEARALLAEAAKLRGCFDAPAPEIPRELVDRKPVVIYATDAEAVGAPKADRRELEAFIDGIAEIPEISRTRAKEDAGILKKNLLARLSADVKDFGDEKD